MQTGIFNYLKHQTEAYPAHTLGIFNDKIEVN